jgi:hypothetical protein
MQNKTSMLVGFHGGVDEVSVLQGYDAASLDKRFLMFKDRYIGLRHKKLRKNRNLQLQPVMMNSDDHRVETIP